MDYNDIPLFVRVVESGSFTAAALALGVQKSSVSRSVSRLEEQLGVRLLQRTTRRLALTEAGQAFFERVRGAIAGVDEAADTVRELGGEPRGLVRLTAPPDAHALGIPEALATFVERYPGIDIECSLTVRRVDMVAEGFDIAVRGGRLEDSSLIARRVSAPHAVMFAAPGYLRRRAAPKRVADLSQHQCVLFRAHGGRATWVLSGPHGEESVEVEGRISVDEMFFAYRACVAGLGVCLLPVSLAREGLQRGELVALLPDYATTSGDLSVVLPSAAFVPARVALLRDHLLAHLQKFVADAAHECKHAQHTSRKR